LEFTLNLAEPRDRANLLAMTPHGWRASAERRVQVIEAAEPLVVTVSMRYDYFVLQ
jgi:23S rRNA (guanine745-N1)-methyltransferase